MAYIILPSRRTRQPRYPTRLSAKYPLQQFVLLPPNSIELVGGVAGTLSGATFGVGAAGNALVIGTPGDFLSFGSRYSTASFTSMFVVEPTSLASVITLSNTNYTAPNLSDGGQQIRIETNGALLLVRDNQAVVLTGGVAGSVAVGRTSCVVYGWDNTSGSGYIAVDGGVTTGAPGTQSWVLINNFVLGRKRGPDTAESGTHKQYLATRWASMLPVSVGVELSRNPWSLFAPDPRRLYFGTSGGGATTTTIEPSKGSLAVAGYAPSIAQPQTVAPTVGHAVVTGKQPGVVQPLVVIPATGRLTATGYAPTIVKPQTQEPITGHLTATGYAPGISQTASGTIAPSTGTLTLTGYAPGIEQDRGVAPSVGHLTLTGYPPGVTQNVTVFIAPSKGALTLTGQQPSISSTAHQVIAPAQGALTLGGYAPVLAQTGAQIIGPVKGVLTLTGYAPTIAVIGAGVTVVEPTQGALSLHGYAPLIGLIIAADAPASSRSLSPDRARLGLSPVIPSTPRLG